MTFRKVSCSILFATVSLAASLSISCVWGQQSTTQKADGGDPQPPWPKPMLTIPSSESQPALMADGGDPQPPWPKPILAIPSSESQPVLMADGGDPQPPFPPRTS